MIFTYPLGSKTKSKSFLRLWLAVMLAGAGGVTPAFAVNYTWSGSGGDNNWSTAGNWRGAVVAVSGPSNALIFAGSLRTTPFADSPFSLSGLSFASSSNPFTLSGTTLTLSNSGTVTNSSSTTQTIAVSDIVLVGSSTWNAASGALSVSSVLTGTGGITKIGTNVLTLSASNTYSGTTTLTAGTLAIGDDGALGASAVLLNGGTLRASGSRTLANATSLVASSAISGTTNFTVTNLTNTGAFTLAISNTGTTSLGAVNLTNNSTARALTLNVTGGPTAVTGTVADGPGVGSLVKAGTGILTLSSSNAYTGTTTLTAGTLVAGNDAALGTSLLVFNGGTLQGNAARTLGNTLQIAASSGISGTSNLTFSNTLTNTGAFSLAITNTGTTTFGAVNLTNNATARTLTLNVTGGPTYLAGAVTNGGGGAGSIVKSGTGLLVMSGSNSYTGTTTVQNGTLRTDSSLALPTGRAVIVGGTVASGTATLDLNGNNASIGTLQLGGAGGKANAVNVVSTGTGTLTLGGDVSTASTGNPGTALITGKLDLGAASRNFTIADSTNTGVELNVSADISGAGGITKLGAGTLMFSSTNNTYAGPTVIAAGALRLSNFNTLPSTTNLQLNGGVIDLAADLALVTGTGAGQLQWIGSGGFSASGTNRTVTLSGGADVVWGSSSFVTNTGTLVLGAAGADSTVTLTNNIDLGGVARTVTAVAGGAATSGILSGTLSGAGGLIVNGSGALQLSGANTYTGSTTITNATLVVTKLANGGTASSLGASSNDASNLVITNGVLKYVGTGDTTDRGYQIGVSGAGIQGYLDASGVGDATHDGAIVFSNTSAIAFGTTNQTRTVELTGSNTADNILAASITNNGNGVTNIYKDGLGKWVLSGSNSYTGSTFIFSGILAVANNAALGSTGTTSMLGDNSTLELQNVNVANVVAVSGSGVNGAGALTATGTSSLTGRLDFDHGDTTVGGTGLLNITAWVREILSTSVITKVGSGTLVLSGTDLVGHLEWVINQGTLVLNHNSAISQAITGTLVTINNGGTLQLAGTGGHQLYYYNTGVTVNSGGLLDYNGRNEAIAILAGSGTIFNSALGTSSTMTVGDINSNFDSAFSGVLQDGAGTLALVKVGTGTFTLSGSSSYSGGTTLSGGLLAVGHDSALGTGLFVFNGGTLQGNGARTLANALRLTNDSEISGTSNLTLTNTLTNTSGNRTLTVSNTGTTIFGAVNLSNDNNARTLTFNTTGGPVLVTGPIADGGAGAGQLAKTGTGSLTLSGSSSFSGNTTIYQGLLSITDAHALGSAAGYTDVYGGATLNLNNVTGVAETIYFDSEGVDSLGAITNTGTSSVTGNVIAKAGGSIGGTGSLTLATVNGQGNVVKKVGPGDLILSGSANNDSLNVRVEAGTVVLAKDSTSSVHAIDGDLVIDDGTVRLAGTGSDQISTGHTLQINGGMLDLNGRNEGISTLFGSGTITNSAATSSTLTVGELDSFSDFGGPIQDGAGSLTLVKVGSSDLYLYGANTYTGGSIVSGGRLIIGLGGTTGGIVGNVALDSGTVLGFYRSDDITFAGLISGAGDVEKRGAGRLTLSGSNTYTGNTTIYEGTLSIASAAALGTADGYTFANEGGTLELNNVALDQETLYLSGSGANGQGALVGTGTSSVATTTLLMNDTTIGVSAGGSLALNGVVHDFGGNSRITKVGAGTLTLANANSYTGGTLVKDGTLVAGNNTAVGSGAVTVEGGVFLVDIDVTIANQVVLSGGAYQRKLSAGASLADAINASSGFAGDLHPTSAALLSGTTSAAATLQSAFANTSSALNDNSRRSDVYTLSGVPIVNVSTGQTDIFVLQLSFTSTDPGSYLAWLDISTNTWVNAINGNFGNNPAFTDAPFLGTFADFQSIYGTDLSAYLGAWGVSETGGVTSPWAVLNHNSDFAVIPEPGTWALLAFGLGALCLVRRRRLS